jgi:hypothetical protein
MSDIRFGKTAAAALIVTVAGILVWGSGVRAFNPQPDPPGFGMIGISYGQTARLSVVNTAGLLSGLPPGPCKVELGFLDDQGRFVRKAGGRDGVDASEPVRKAGRLEPGQSMTLDLSSNDVMLDGSGRMQVRAAWLNAEVGKFPPGPCRASLEMIETMTGRTSFALQGSAVMQDFH